MLGPAKGYIDLLDEHIINKKLEEQKEPPKWNPLRPSAAGYCERALGYAYAEYLGRATYPQEEIKPDTIRLLDFGKSVEYHFIQQLKYTKLFQIKYQQQVLTFLELDERTLVEGSIDLCLYFEEHKCIADIKSKGTRASHYRADSWDQVDADLSEWSSIERINDRLYWIEDLPLFLKQCNDPWMADNFYQLNLYACSEFMLERKIDHAVLFYYDKNKSRLREIRFKPSRVVAQRTKLKFETIHKVIAHNEHGLNELCLMRESELGSIRCSYCRFASVCRPGIDTKQAYFDTWPEKSLPVNIADLSAATIDELETHYDFIKNATSIQQVKSTAEQQICNFMEKEKIKKLKFLDNEVYECKLLKTPKPHFELRRSR